MLTRQPKNRNTIAAMPHTHRTGVARVLMVGSVVCLALLASTTLGTDARVIDPAAKAKQMDEATGQVSLLVPRKIRFIIGYQKVKTA